MGGQTALRTSVKRSTAGQAATGCGASRTRCMLAGPARWGHAHLRSSLAVEPGRVARRSTIMACSKAASWPMARSLARFIWPAGARRHAAGTAQCKRLWGELPRWKQAQSGKARGGPHSTGRCLHSHVVPLLSVACTHNPKLTSPPRPSPARRRLSLAPATLTLLQLLFHLGKHGVAFLQKAMLCRHNLLLDIHSALQAGRSRRRLGAAARAAACGRASGGSRTSDTCWTGWRTPEELKDTKTSPHNRTCAACRAASSPAGTAWSRRSASARPAWARASSASPCTQLAAVPQWLSSAT